MYINNKLVIAKNNEKEFSEMKQESSESIFLKKKQLNENEEKNNNRLYIKTIQSNNQHIC